MNINADINVLGSISDYSLIVNYLKAAKNKDNGHNDFHSYSSLKTTKSFERYERAFKSTLLKFKNAELRLLIESILENEGVSTASMLLLFWNSSGNNEFLHYLNQMVFFPALYSGRIAVKKGEVIACMKDLRQHETGMQKWTDSTIDVAARKYIAFLSKVNLMEGGREKTITRRYIDDKQFMIFVYWLLAVETKPNIFNSQWLQYALMEKQAFIERITRKIFRQWISIQYSGDNLKIETLCKYEDLYDRLRQSGS